jgi:hypothetical protein
MSDAWPLDDGLEISRHERQAAEVLSEQIDQLLVGHEVDISDPRLTVAAQLSRLPGLLAPVDRAFERRVLGSQAGVAAPSRKLGWRLPVRALALAAVALIVVLAVVLTSPGQSALARLAAMFQLESVRVAINVPTDTPGDGREVAVSRVERPLASLTLAQAVAPVDILAPSEIPAGWSLAAITAVYYPDLPADVPLNIVLTYQRPGGSTLRLVEYFIRLGDNLTVDALTREDEISTSARQITLNEWAAVLIESAGPPHLYTLIWEQDGLLIELDGRGVTLQDLMLLAQSMQPLQ